MKNVTVKMVTKTQILKMMMKNAREGFQKKKIKKKEKKEIVIAINQNQNQQNV